MTLSDHAAQIGTALSRWPRQRVRLDELWQLLDDADPTSRTSVHRRRRLHETLGELAATGAIGWPGTGSYDRSEQPALPRFVTVPQAEQRGPARQPVVWHHALSWVVDAAIAPRQRVALEQINRWLFSCPSDLVVPLRERSLEVLGDEKALDRMATTSLFGPGRLSLELLRARRVTPPLHTITVGDGPLALVVENSDTVDSLATVLAREPGRVGVLGWGAGGAFEASVLSLTRLARSVRDIVYFGDLDAPGLRIPHGAGLLAVRSGLPPVRPARGLYAALREVGRESGGQPRLAAATAASLADWLDPAHRSWAVAALTSGVRVAQEAVGLAYLSGTTTWRVDLG